MSSRNPSQVDESELFVQEEPAEDSIHPHDTCLPVATTSESLSIRVAYATFFGVQVASSAYYFIVLHQSSNSPVFSFWSFSTFLTLGTIFAFAQNLSIESAVGIKMLVIFWFHNFVSLSMTVFRVGKGLFGVGSHNGAERLDINMGLLYLFWVICGSTTIKRVWTRRQQPVE